MAKAAGFRFCGVPALPLLSLRNAGGWRGLSALLRSTLTARKFLKAEGIEVVFGTGGYGAAPAIAAARSLRIPYVVHESNSIPGRVNRMFAPRSRAVTSVFRKTAEVISGTVRTGQPIRAALREAVAKVDREKLVLVLGGSQGAAALNRLMPEVARQVPDFHWFHAVGRKNFDQVSAASLPSNYEPRAYIESDEMAETYGKASLAVARSGGTLAEFAAFRLPSVLIPLPTSAGNHQLENAKEFAAMGAATLVEERDASVDSVGAAVREWLDAGPDRLNAAANALAEWDIPDATPRICDLILK